MPGEPVVPWRLNPFSQRSEESNFWIDGPINLAMFVPLGWLLRRIKFSMGLIILSCAAFSIFNGNFITELFVFLIYLL